MKNRDVGFTRDQVYLTKSVILRKHPIYALQIYPNRTGSASKNLMEAAAPKHEGQSIQQDWT
ncbi:hypothetical protein CA265_20365 [Sphingobacteriaceae bacterium GW460-11-11-14-LB5]|nr:hypothetical protein CA265_20365 [Sphingobacteriaceae bacterium GW460-11-11-14-LB5]